MKAERVVDGFSSLKKHGFIPPPFQERIHLVRWGEVGPPISTRAIIKEIHGEEKTITAKLSKRGFSSQLRKMKEESYLWMVAKHALHDNFGKEWLLAYLPPGLVSNL
eukprot:TRINITY_DN5974_c1_g1_i3.p2 TRINITY_DN5974_c1_g1~~TRINITY_DN5974_c1_g1_i3.p2  ORF type:complete len:107 (+),score=17.84 TRINITY_DN5974_c1_g1_i3:263-583(+)